MYQIIYADPAWKYKDKCHAGKRGADYKYETMTLEEMCEIPVREWTSKDAVCFMWATWPFMNEAQSLMRAWGFIYKTCAFIWVKTNKNNGAPFIGMGNWTRSNSEFCILGIKGKPRRFDSKAARTVSQVIIEPKREHSRKPDCTRDRIVTLCGDVPRLEMFARTATPGWNVWGNETSKFDKEDELILAI